MWRADRDSVGESAPVFSCQRGAHVGTDKFLSSGTTAAVRDCEGLLEEHRFMAHLAAHGAAVPRVLGDMPQVRRRLERWRVDLRSARDPARRRFVRDALSWTPFRSTCTRTLRVRCLRRYTRRRLDFRRPAANRGHWWRVHIFAADDPSAALERYIGARPALAQMRRRDQLHAPRGAAEPHEAPQPRSFDALLDASHFPMPCPAGWPSALTS